jgi:hypothetical protein
VIVTIHQPEHFPYMGFFQKAKEADLLIILDTVNYRKNYFQNRNKIRSLAGKDEWITVPVEKKATSKNIKDIMVSKDPNWRKKLVKKIYENLKFDATEFYSHEKLIDINMASIQWAFKKLDMNTKFVYASQLNVDGAKSELLVNLCKEVNATKYISGPSGREYLDMSLFEGLPVEFFQPEVDNFYSCLYNLV